MDIYSPLHPAAFFMIEMRLRIVRKILAAHYGKNGLANLSLLEVGCGNAQWLTELVMLGFNPKNLAGIELNPERVNIASKRVPDADIRYGDAGNLPWENNSFDIVLQSTLFTSVPDTDSKQKIASEMMRVSKKDGLILWYDFIFDNPNNPNTKAISKKEVLSLFAPRKCKFYSVTLAPPIARRLTRYSVLLCEALETFLPFLNTHIIAEITPGD